jgi:hypothetical protein
MDWRDNMITKRKYDDKWILAIKPYSSNPKDHYLEIVLCYLPTNKITPYVTWIYNHDDDNGFHEGHYHQFINNAIPEFMTRGLKYDDEFIKKHDAIEVQFIQFYGEHGMVPCSEKHAQLISVYLYLPEKGVECITNHFDGKDAARIVRWISNTYELPMGYYPKNYITAKLKPIN